MENADLKRRLQSRIKHESTHNVILQDLPADFTYRLQEFLTTSRAQTIFYTTKRKHYVQIDVSPSKMEAYASVCIDVKSADLTADELHFIVSAAGVNYGLTVEFLSAMTIGEHLKNSFVGVIVASGDKPISGKAGYIEVLKETYEPDATRDLENFDCIQENEIIATVHPPEKGVPGANVFGDEEIPQQESSCSYKFNKYIKSLNSGDSISLIAMSGGHLLKRENELVLKKELELSGEITMHRGALNYNEDVVLNGNICENTSMTLSKNLRIEGMVSSSQLNVNGDILIQQGVFGKGEAVLKSGRQVQAKYINETTVECETATIAKEIMNSQLWISDYLHAEKAICVGGQCFAMNGMVMAQLGSHLGLPGLVSAGQDYYEYKISKELMPELKKIEKDLKAVLIRAKSALGASKQNLLKHIKELKNEYDHRKEEIERLQQHIHERNKEAKIIVKRAIYPGVVLMIAGTESRVKEKISGPVEISLVDEKVQFSIV